jgi:hypothetical protein
MTGTLIDLAARLPLAPDLPADTVMLVGAPLNRCDAPTVTGVCASLVVRGELEENCGGLLAYQLGAWQHVNMCSNCYTGGVCPAPGGHRSCTDPEPETCDHSGCLQTADIDQECTRGYLFCCGCCWLLEDGRDGRRMWLR